MGAVLLSNTLQTSITTNHSSLASALFHSEVGKQHTPPSPSLTTNTNPFLNPLSSSHFLYNVPRLTPCSSRLYTRFHSSHNCNRGGTSNLISSANALLNNLALSSVPSCQPFKATGYNGGGWNGLAVRYGGVYTSPGISVGGKVGECDGVCVFGGSEEKRRRSPETDPGRALVQEEERGAGVEVPEEDDVEGCWWSCVDLGYIFLAFLEVFWL
jgi:hypothetical protein